MLSVCVCAVCVPVGGSVSVVVSCHAAAAAAAERRWGLAVPANITQPQTLIFSVRKLRTQTQISSSSLKHLPFTGYLLSPISTFGNTNIRLTIYWGIHSILHVRIYMYAG